MEENRKWIDVRIDQIEGPLDVTIHGHSYNVLLPVSELPRRILVTLRGKEMRFTFKYNFDEEPSDPDWRDLGSGLARVELGLHTRKLHRLSIDVDAHGADQAALSWRDSLPIDLRRSVETMMTTAKRANAKANYKAALISLTTAMDEIGELLPSAP